MTSSRMPQLGPRGEGWVALQLVLLVAIGAAGLLEVAHRTPEVGAASIVGALLIVVGGLLAVRALLDLGSSLSPLPRPVRGNQLVETGAYRLIRHPIYSGIVLAGAGWGVLTGSWPAVALTALLFVLFDAKSRREEAWLTEVHPDYAAYRAHTRRLVPWLY